MKKLLIWFISLLFAVLLLYGSASAEQSPYVELFPRSTMAVGGSLDFQFNDFDAAEDQYAHILREEADGTFTVVAVFKAWDAASGTRVNTIEAGLVTEPGDYWLTLGADPDYAGLDEDAIVGIPFKSLEKQLETPEARKEYFSDKPIGRMTEQDPAVWDEIISFIKA